ncbi:MAG: diaminopimelate decarboxylase [Chloroflexi bacterium]|nr:diaminopimelate decarboxylase [Chloroflexota bacterium]
MDRLPLFPDTVSIVDDRLTVGGFSLADLARDFGTPLYLYDRVTMDNAVAAYRQALAAHYPASSQLTYAGKAYLNLAVAQWARESGLWVDCTGAGEIAMTVAGGLPRERILVHGVNKSNADLQAAFERAGTLVVDHLEELEQIAPLTSDSAPELWLRLQPGLAVDTHHAHTQTGQYDSKFGMTREEWREAAVFCRDHHLPLTGIHFHQGSNFRDPEPLLPAIDLALDLAREVGFAGTWHFCPGGGWGMAYHEDELPNPSIESYVRGIAEALTEGCRLRGLDLPQLHLEPGRSLIARAGVAVYRVGARKRRGDHTWLLVDGGLADNPRYALYGARYSALTVAGPGRERVERVHLAGPYCESGDILLKGLMLPKIEAGEWIAVPMSGAYQLSMASNYNGAQRPAVLWLEGGTARLIQRRETPADLLQRDLGKIHNDLP